jgi:hypothetical protein
MVVSIVTTEVVLCGDAIFVATLARAKPGWPTSLSQNLRRGGV